MSHGPAEGERRAATGYRNQYLVGAALILDALNSRDLEWIRVADPEAGRVDDLQIATTARLDAYQVKWAQYGGTITLAGLAGETAPQASLMAQLADGWRRLRGLHPDRRIVVHLITNDHASIHTPAMPEIDDPPSPYHFAAFIDQEWEPKKQDGRKEQAEPWGPTWNKLRDSTGLSEEEFTSFVADCELHLATQRPQEEPDVQQK